MSENKQNNQIQIKANDNDIKGKYSNMMQIAHTREEFVLDYMNITPPVGALVSRIIVSPPHAKRIFAALADNIKKYESQFGEITQSVPPQDPGKMGFKLE